MEKFFVIADWHYGGAFPKSDKYAHTLPTLFGPNVIYVGDIFDFSGCLKKNLPALIKEYEEFLRKCRETGTRVIAGNHECKHGRMYGYSKSGILLTHIHRAVWEKNKCIRWEHKDGGKSWIKYKAIVFKNCVGSKWGHGVEEEDLLMIAKYALANECTVIIGGHKHPSEMVDKMVGVTDEDGFVHYIRVVIGARGVNEVMLPFGML